jgi:hypothetical protein
MSRRTRSSRTSTTGQPRAKSTIDTTKQYAATASKPSRARPGTCQSTSNHMSRQSIQSEPSSRSFARLRAQNTCFSTHLAFRGRASMRREGRRALGRWLARQRFSSLVILCLRIIAIPTALCFGALALVVGIAVCLPRPLVGIARGCSGHHGVLRLSGRRRCGKDARHGRDFGRVFGCLGRHLGAAQAAANAAAAVR